MSKPWIGVDLDGTLAVYIGWHGIENIGAPVPRMLERVKRWLDVGMEVRIFTARAGDPKAVAYINVWSAKHIGQVLPVTNVKDYDMMELWDDRAIHVEPNTGRRLP